MFSEKEVMYNLKPRSQMPLRTATNAVRTIFRQWTFGKTMEKQGDSYEIIVRTNLCDRRITRLFCSTHVDINYFLSILVSSSSSEVDYVYAIFSTLLQCHSTPCLNVLLSVWFSAPFLGPVPSTFHSNKCFKRLWCLWIWPNYLSFLSSTIFKDLIF